MRTRAYNPSYAAGLACEQDAKTRLVAELLEEKDWGRTLFIDNGTDHQAPQHHRLAPS